MRNKHISDGGLAALAGIALCTASVTFSAAQDSKVRILQTNSAGDNTHIIDPATNKVELHASAHGTPADVAASGRRIVVANGPLESSLAVIDASTGSEEDVFSLGAGGPFFGSPSVPVPKSISFRQLLGW